MVALLSLCLLGGSVVGLLNSMFGVGGAFIVIPLLDEILLRLGMDPAVSHLMAVGTSPLTLLCTCVSSFLAHRKLGSMRDDILRRVAPFLLLGGVAGAFLAPHAPTSALKLLFYGIISITTAQVVFPMKRFEHTEEDLRWIEPVSVFFGLIASMSGVAGSLMNIIYLNWRGVPWLQAVGTGAGIGLIISLTSTAGYLCSGWNVPGLPEWSLGYIYLPGMLCLLLPTVLMARVGAKLMHWSRMPVDAMKKGICTLLFLYALTMAARTVWGMVG